ncbi:MAG: histidine kinase dimerization/phospho-acceptor domain-containing protein [Deinococcales bacterium]
MNFMYFDELKEGLIFVEGGYVQGINKAAMNFLGLAEDSRVKHFPLIAVVRDHRIEAAYLKQEALEVERFGRMLKVRPFKNVIILEDISEAQQLKENARELLAVLSHELRTPVSTIRSTLEALHMT